MENPELTTNQQVENYLTSIGVVFEVFYLYETKKHDWPCDKWLYTIKSGKGKMTGEYCTGLGNRKSKTPVPSNIYRNTIGYVKWQRDNVKPVKPEIAGIVYSLLLDGQACNMCFGDWAEEYGFDIDSRKAEAIYDECVKIGLDLRKVFTHAQKEYLQYLLQDY